MLKIKKYLFLMFLIIFCKAYAIDYQCPKINNDITVGSYISKNWLIWPLDEEINKLNIYYYKYFVKKYNIKIWNAYPHGEYGGIFKGEKYYIACCRQVKIEKKRICAIKSVNTKNCKPILKRNPTVKFICTK